MKKICKDFIKESILWPQEIFYPTGFIFLLMRLLSRSYKFKYKRYQIFITIFYLVGSRWGYSKAAFLSGFASVLVTTPFWVINTRMSTDNFG